MSKAKPKRTFTRLSETWYASANPMKPGVSEEISIGIDAGHQDGAEFHVNWIDIGGKAVPQLIALDEAWAVLASAPDLIAALGQICGQCYDPDQFIEVLKSCGFAEATERVNPRPNQFGAPLG